MRVLITGSRNHADYQLVSDALAFATRYHDIEDVTIVQGEARGADYLAKRWAQSHQIHQEPHPAQWKKLGKAAGGERNKEMVDLGADVCIAFPLEDSRGTWDCVRRAQKAGIDVWIVRPHVIE